MKAQRWRKVIFATDSTTSPLDERWFSKTEIMHERFIAHGHGWQTLYIDRGWCYIDYHPQGKLAAIYLRKP
jgi:hypothetical protein